MYLEVMMKRHSCLNLLRSILWPLVDGVRLVKCLICAEVSMFVDLWINF